MIEKCNEYTNDKNVNEKHFLPQIRKKKEQTQNKN